MDVVDFVGRVLFGILFLQNGYFHIRHRAGMVGFAKSFGTPMAEISVPATGVLMLVGGTLIILGVWVDLACFALFLFVVAAGLFAHRYWEEADYPTRAAQQAQFMKNMAIAGACLFLAALFNQFSDGMSITLGGPFF
jgi:putative oxidoreductase